VSGPPAEHNGTSRGVPALPPLPATAFLERAPGQDAEVRAWVAAARGTIAALHEALLAATARAEAAEWRLAAGWNSATDPGPNAPPATEAQARFQSAAEAATSVIAEARAVLREVRDGITTPQVVTPDAAPPRGAPPASSPPPPAGPPPPPHRPSPPPGRPTADPGPNPPGSVPARSGGPRAATDRPAPPRPPGYDPSVVLPPHVPNRGSGRVLGRLFGRPRR
jgi:hypothetical protein